MYRDVVFAFGFFSIGAFLVWLLSSGKFIEAIAVLVLVGLFLVYRSTSANSRRKSETKTDKISESRTTNPTASVKSEGISSSSSQSEQLQPISSLPTSNTTSNSNTISVNLETYSTARLQARHKPVLTMRSPGTYKLGLDRGRDGLIHIPRNYTYTNPAPLIVWLHGAGMDAETSISITSLTDKYGCIVLMPESRSEMKWDFSLGLSSPSLSTMRNTPGKVSLYAFIEEGTSPYRRAELLNLEPGIYGLDIAFIDKALAYTFDRYAVDLAHIAVAGYSDGAAYALSVGVTNGDLFTHVLAFAPVYMAPPSKEGKPHIFISHGREDEVIPIQTSRDLIVPELQEMNYDVYYYESNDSHTVTPESLYEAMNWFSR